MTDAARITHLTSLALRTLNTMHNTPAYAGQCATDATKNELVDTKLVRRVWNRGEDRCYLTPLGKRIASKAQGAINSKDG